MKTEPNWRAFITYFNDKHISGQQKQTGLSKIRKGINCSRGEYEKIFFPVQEIDDADAYPGDPFRNFLDFYLFLVHLLFLFFLKKQRKFFFESMTSKKGNNFFQAAKLAYLYIYLYFSTRSQIRSTQLRFEIRISRGSKII